MLKNIKTLKKRVLITFASGLLTPFAVFAVMQSINTVTGQNQTLLSDISNISVVSSTSANSHTLKWSGVLPISKGGTGAGSFTDGSLLFYSGASISQDNSNLFWDDSNNRLGVGTNTPSNKIDVIGTVEATQVAANTIVASGSNQSLSLNPTGTGRVLVGGESLVVSRLSSKPASASTGQIYFDTSLVKFRGYNGTDWVNFEVSVSQTHPMTANGNVQVDTAQSKFGGAAALFDGTGDYISSPDHADWNFTAADATIDFWMRVNAMPAGIADGLIGQNATSDGNWMIYLYPNGSIGVGRNGINEIVTASGLITTNTWHHIAVVRINSSSTTKIFIDGVEKASNTTAVWNDPTTELKIGRNVDGDFDGWIDEIRVSNVVRWTTNFTPPSAAYNSDANTKLLLHNDGTDGSIVFTDVSQ